MSSDRPLTGLCHPTPHLSYNRATAWPWASCAKNRRSGFSLTSQQTAGAMPDPTSPRILATPINPHQRVRADSTRFDHRWRRLGLGDDCAKLQRDAVAAIERVGGYVGYSWQRAERDVGLAASTQIALGLTGCAGRSGQTLSIP